MQQLILYTSEDGRRLPSAFCFRRWAKPAAVCGDAADVVPAGMTREFRLNGQSRFKYLIDFINELLV